MRIRTDGSLNGVFVKYMDEHLYTIIGRGEKATIDGISGQWVWIKGLLNGDIGWVFSGYLKKLTDKEVDEFFSI